MTYDISYIGKHIGTVEADSIDDASQKVMDDIDIVPVVPEEDEFAGSEDDVAAEEHEKEQEEPDPENR